MHERTKIEHFRAKPVGKKKRSNQYDSPDKKDIIARNVMLSSTAPKNDFGSALLRPMP